jgi:hypothetical protein
MLAKIMTNTPINPRDVIGLEDLINEVRALHGRIDLLRVQFVKLTMLIEDSRKPAQHGR